MTTFLILVIMALCLTFGTIFIDQKRLIKELETDCLNEQLKRREVTLEDAKEVMDAYGFTYKFSNFQ